MNSYSEVGRFFEKLNTWRNESHREFSNIVKLHRNSINKGINDLAKEVEDLRDKLSVITRERNDLLETVHNLTNDIGLRSAELQGQEEVLHPEEMNTNFNQEIGCSDIEDNKEQNIRSETDVPNCSTFSESVDPLDIVEEDEQATNGNDEGGNLKQKETVRTKRKGIPKDSSPGKSPEFESYQCTSSVKADVHVCPECNFAVSNLEIHMKNIHSNMEEGFNNRKSIQNKGNKQFQCKQCSYKSVRPDHLRYHIKTVHESMRAHLCGECGYASALQKDMKRHIDGVHKKIKNYVCGECGYAASQKGNLKQHVQVRHEGIRNHICGVCGHATAEKGKLRIHIKRKHEKMKHNCEECGYTNSRKEDLKKHKQSAHNKGVEKIIV